MTRYPTVRKYDFVFTVVNWYVLFKVDGCAKYKVLSEADRAQGNAVKNSLWCDDGLVTGWNRFQGAAGDRMADKCFLMYRCGTVVPGWLYGSHPTIAEGVVTRKVCYHRYGDCCWQSSIIQVKNCSSYYVYKLQKLPGCPLRYCGNAGAGKLYSK